MAPACEQVSVRARNHDQVGNRARGERLAGDALRVAAAVTLFSPCTPLLFMGEERFETAPVVDEEAKILRLRRGHVTLVADFGNRRVEFSR